MLDYEFLYIISIPIYIILVLIFIGKKINLKEIVINSFFYFYIISLIAVTFFPIPIQGLNEVGLYMGQNSNNFIPFVSILDILLNDDLSIFIKIKQVIGNIIIFIPMGFFIANSKNNFKKALILGLGFSIGIELFQYIISFLLGFSYKVTDVDDILLNVIGFIIGLFLYRFFKKVYQIKKLK